MNFGQIFGAIALTAIMVLGLLLAASGIQEQNNAVQPLSSNALFEDTLGNLSTTLDANEGVAGTQYNAFINEEPPKGVFSILLFGIVSVGKSFANMVQLIFSTVIKLPLVVLGIPPTVVSMVLAWLVIGICTALWVLYKLGG